jgi:hypothetical protein
VINSASAVGRFAGALHKLRGESLTKPDKSKFSDREWALIQKLDSPARIQRFLTNMPYNWEKKGATLRSFREMLKHNEVHCLEAAVSAAVILEQHGYPPLLLDLESQDLLDHVLFVFKLNGRWGSIARSRDLGLHGRKPVFRSIRDLVWSYFEPYVDLTGRIKGYGVTSLYNLGNYDWRFSPRKMTKIEDHLRTMPHKKLVSSDTRYERLLAKYKAFKQRHPDRPPDYYQSEPTWMM